MDYSFILIFEFEINGFAAALYYTSELTCDFHVHMIAALACNIVLQIKS